MIFFTVGNDHHKFPRFMEIIYALHKKNSSKYSFFLQYGHSEPPKLPISMSQFLNKEEFEKKIKQSEHIICHGGAGTIAQSIQAGKKPIVIPRRYDKNEHLNDHQLDIAQVFLNKKLCFIEDNPEKIQNILDDKVVKHIQFNSTKNELIYSLKGDIDKLG